MSRRAQNKKSDFKYRFLIRILCKGFSSFTHTFFTELRLKLEMQDKKGLRVWQIPYRQIISVRKSPKICLINNSVMHCNSCNAASPGWGFTLNHIHIQIQHWQEIPPFQRRRQASTVDRKDRHNIISISKDLPNRWPWIIFKAWLKLVRWKCLTQETAPLCAHGYMW